MGVRLYSPGIGRFLQTDPEDGGNATAYDYCAGDPVNCTDLDGRWGFRHFFKRVASWAWEHKWDIALTVVSFTPGFGAAAWAYRGYRAYRAYRTYRAVRAARSFSRACRWNSFTPNTRVLMGNGTTKPIGQIHVGDLIQAGDPDTGEVSTEQVTDVIVGAGEKDLVTIRADADHDGRTGVVVATAGHPFYTDGGWEDAQDLDPGDWLSTDRWTTFPITTTARAHHPATVYNLTVSRLHTYYVILDGTPTLVHNCWRPPIRIRVSNMRSALKAQRRWMERLRRRGYQCSTRGHCGQGDYRHIDWKKNGTAGRIHFGPKRAE
jgi:hypothetical protein